jgi:hypothetical protein
MMLAEGQAVEATVYCVLFGSPRWLALAPAIARVRLPARPRLADRRLTRTPAHRPPPVR